MPLLAVWSSASIQSTYYLLRPSRLSISQSKPFPWLDNPLELSKVSPCFARSLQSPFSLGPRRFFREVACFFSFPLARRFCGQSEDTHDDSKPRRAAGGIIPWEKLSENIVDRGKSAGPTWEAMGCGVRGMLTHHPCQFIAAPWPLEEPPHNNCHTIRHDIIRRVIASHSYRYSPATFRGPPCFMVWNLRASTYGTYRYVRVRAKKNPKNWEYATLREKANNTQPPSIFPKPWNKLVQTFSIFFISKTFWDVHFGLNSRR